eukprot:5177953-Amphidinium_carterae.1
MIARGREALPDVYDGKRCENKWPFTLLGTNSTSAPASIDSTSCPHFHLGAPVGTSPHALRLQYSINTFCVHESTQCHSTVPCCKLCSYTTTCHGVAALSELLTKNREVAQHTRANKRVGGANDLIRICHLQLYAASILVPRETTVPSKTSKEFSSSPKIDIARFSQTQ